MVFRLLHHSSLVAGGVTRSHEEKEKCAFICARQLGCPYSVALSWSSLLSPWQAQRRRRRCRSGWKVRAFSAFSAARSIHATAGSLQRRGRFCECDRSPGTHSDRGGGTRAAIVP